MPNLGENENRGTDPDRAKSTFSSFENQESGSYRNPDH